MKGFFSSTFITKTYGGSKNGGFRVIHFIMTSPIKIPFNKSGSIMTLKLYLPLNQINIAVFLCGYTKSVETFLGLLKNN
jgi:hypothetical protein